MQKLLRNAISEDLGVKGDITSSAIFDKEDTSAAIIKSKSIGILSGAYIIQPLFELIDPGVKVLLGRTDGDRLQPGTVICRLEGPVVALLSGERIALNFLQRFSGIATLTSHLVKAIGNTTTRLLDTRKTTPGLRLLEKRAVCHGGGFNHRFGLFDMILIKDTHVKRAGGVKQALLKAFSYREQHRRKCKIEVEVQSIAEFREAIALHPDRIMLDNMKLKTIKECVTIRNESKTRIELEASGNITLQTIAAVASTGVDFISCGAVTHSAPALDIHMVISDG